MSNKGFAEIQTDIETPNGVNVTEKPLKTDRNKSNTTRIQTGGGDTRIPKLYKRCRYR